MNEPRAKRVVADHGARAHVPASGHAAQRAATLQSAHVFTVAGAALLISVFSASMYRLGAVRKKAAARSSG